MEGLRVRYADSTLRLTSLDNVIVAAWFDAPVLDHMRVIDRQTRYMRREHDVGFVYVNVAVTGIPKFSKEVIDEIERMGKLVTERDLATAHVVLMNGLAGTAVRTFLSTALLVSRPPEPNKVFADLTASVRWMLRFLTAAGHYVWTDERLLSFLQAAIQT